MNIHKQHQKLVNAQQAAALCTSREEALKILKKAKKITRKLEAAH